jgi:hypothetical protein
MMLPMIPGGKRFNCQFLLQGNLAQPPAQPMDFRLAYGFEMILQQSNGHLLAGRQVLCFSMICPTRFASKLRLEESASLYPMQSNLNAHK